MKNMLGKVFQHYPKLLQNPPKVEENIKAWEVLKISINQQLIFSSDMAFKEQDKFIIEKKKGKRDASGIKLVFFQKKINPKSQVF
ncbi:MAG: hypothetical protein CM15mP12_5370 [Gammaproteobacteria bacterium]|nr:MAG: hypothetical protein CM15mP12_5370 [Gammaproteobacteria bacterium]